MSSALCNYFSTITCATVVCPALTRRFGDFPRGVSVAFMTVSPRMNVRGVGRPDERRISRGRIQPRGRLPVSVSVLLPSLPVRAAVGRHGAVAPVCAVGAEGVAWGRSPSRCRACRSPAHGAVPALCTLRCPCDVPQAAVVSPRAALGPASHFQESSAGPASRSQQARPVLVCAPGPQGDVASKRTKHRVYKGSASC